jgi:hypothetical protein
MKNRYFSSRAFPARAGVVFCLCFFIGVRDRTAAQTTTPGAPPPTLTGSWPLRSKIEEHGVAPFAVWTTEAWGNVAGGLQQGGWWNSLLDFGVELDTAKLGWWQGGSFLVQAHWVQGLRNDVCFDDYTGGFNPVSSVMAGNHLRVFNLYYRQAWREEAVVLKPNRTQLLSHPRSRTPRRQ